ncbi:hypothetical protein ACO0K0_18995 [Undibacterium sp. SXout11W]|uniref:hypothetical protein n=1 Tax=Undibacterium sp. SXout11W TaxID=3413050 RepID=UPI003BF40CA6
MTTSEKNQVQEFQQASKKAFVEPLMEKVDITLTETHVSPGAPNDFGIYNS